MALVKHKHKEHGSSLLSNNSGRKMPSTLAEDANPYSPASISETSTNQSRTNNDSLVHSIIKAVV